MRGRAFQYVGKAPTFEPQDNHAHMFGRFFIQLTPRTSKKTRLLTAAIVWSLTGTFLMLKGVLFPQSGNSLILAALLGMSLGIMKSRLIFDATAHNIIRHIGTKPERACLGGLFSIRNWALILAMSLFGKAIGALPLSAAVKTCIYVMAGCGLAYSSRLLWTAWRRSPLAGA